MKQLLLFSFCAIILLACGGKKNPPAIQDKKISLQRDTLNSVTMSDTMVIYESTCRGCAYEGSTRFDVADSLGVVKLQAIITTDNNSPDMAGGNVSKQLVLVPLKTGNTIIRVYKSYTGEMNAADSARSVAYRVEVKN